MLLISLTLQPVYLVQLFAEVRLVHVRLTVCVID